VDEGIGKRMLYRGRVQGVGFRYTAQRLAGSLPVAGYVRNLPSGEVELVAEGSPHAVENLLEQVARQMAGYIESSSAQDQPVQGFHGFRIRT
jgi:acylphosphatase